jgi:hypothetical protein
MNSFNMMTINFNFFLHTRHSREDFLLRNKLDRRCGFQNLKQTRTVSLHRHFGGEKQAWAFQYQWDEVGRHGLSNFCEARALPENLRRINHNKTPKE